MTGHWNQELDRFVTTAEEEADLNEMVDMAERDLELTEMAEDDPFRPAFKPLSSVQLHKAAALGTNGSYDDCFMPLQKQLTPREIAARMGGL